MISKVFRHVITGLVSILLDAIILKSRLLAQSRGGNAREKGRGRREGGGCELRSRLHRAADSRRRLLRYQYYRGRGESLEAAAQSARTQVWAVATACPSSCCLAATSHHSHGTIVRSHWRRKQELPALGPRYLEDGARAGKKETRVSAARP